MKRLTKAQVILLHEHLVQSSGGEMGLRDDGLLESALDAPFHSYEGKEAFPTLQQKAARLGFGLIKNHAFVDGNKRIGVHTMLVFLAINGIELQCTQEELSDMVLRVAAGNSAFEDMVKWVISHQE